MKHLITAEEFKYFVRPISDHVDQERIMVCVDEAERLDVRPNIGDETFLDIVYHFRQEYTFDDTYDYTFNGDPYEMILMGGIYEDCKGKWHIMKGLKATIAYYAYARLMRLAGMTLTRYGLVAKTDEYSERLSAKEKAQAVTDVRIVADGYLREVLFYLSQVKCDCGEKYRALFKYGRTRFNTIGD